MKMSAPPPSRFPPPSSARVGVAKPKKRGPNWAKAIPKTETAVFRDFAHFLRPTESALQIAVVEHLRRTAVPGCLYFSIPNEGKRTPANGARMKAMGMLPGVADLFVKRPLCKPLFLELKQKGRKPRLDQLAFQHAAEKATAIYHWADNIDDALKILRTYGAIRSR